MLILEGSPGAGKTTLLGRLLAGAPEHVVVFPEAQPSPDLNGAADAGVAAFLLTEDRDRLAAAARLRGADPSLVFCGDRCHLGVLAYRYALAATGNGGWADYQHADALCERYGLHRRHRGDTVLVLLIDPGQSVRRRAAHATDPAYALWYDPLFLTAYNDFFGQLDTHVPTGPAWQVISAARHDAPWRAVQAAMPVTQAEPGSQDGRSLSCAYGCADPRSPVVQASGAAVQLFTGALHHQPPGRPVECLTSGTQITARYLRHTPGP